MSLLPGATVKGSNASETLKVSVGTVHNRLQETGEKAEKSSKYIVSE